MPEGGNESGRTMSAVGTGPVLSGTVSGQALCQVIVGCGTRVLDTGLLLM